MHCPLCLQAELVSTHREICLDDVLHRWEAASQAIRFPSSVWDFAAAHGEPIEIFQCPTCSFGCTYPVVPGSQEFYETISAVDYYNEEKWEFEQAEEDLKSHARSNILDVGCGSGFFLDGLKRGNPTASLTGYDANSALLPPLAARGLKVLSDLRDCTERFDAITMLQVLEHVGDPVDLLKQCTSLLSKDGSLIITTPNAAGPIRHFPDAHTELPPHHLTFWTANTFLKSLPLLGLEVVSLKYEPLPDYLWDSYLPAIWPENPWPAQIFDPVGKARGLESISQLAGFAAHAMTAAGIRRLNGIPGHTIYVHARRRS
jgi:SAM-dependent methyltransferase